MKLLEKAVFFSGLIAFVCFMAALVHFLKQLGLK